jgi:hypothetical protein
VWCSVLFSCGCLTLGVIILLLYYYILYIYYYILYTILSSSSVLFSFPHPSSYSSFLSNPLLPLSSSYSPILPPLSLLYFLNHSILVGTYIYLFIFQTHPPTIRPRTFYRSGWLRCDVGNGIRFCLCLELVCLTFDVRCYIVYYYYILYIILSYTLLYIIILYITIIISYTILYSSVLPSDLYSSSSPSLPIPIFILYLSVLGYPYLYSSPSSIPHLPLPSQYSFYTCRYLHALIYITPILPIPI